MRTELAEALTRLLAGLGLRFAADADVAVNVLLGTYEAAARDAYVAGRDAPDPRSLETLPAGHGRLSRCTTRRGPRRTPVTPTASEPSPRAAGPRRGGSPP